MELSYFQGNLEGISCSHPQILIFIFGCDLYISFMRSDSRCDFGLCGRCVISLGVVSHVPDHTGEMPEKFSIALMHVGTGLRTPRHTRMELIDYPGLMLTRLSIPGTF